ncbi:MAG: class I SAM-dependent methyltransferase [Thermoprotei archaeon]|nr:class I SAM-dependent methyltransferase [Thermoprotei archaeon]
MSYKVFDKYAEKYDSWYSRNKVIAENEVLALKKLRLKGLGLEVGVGTGFFSSKLSVNLGLDPALRMLKIAKNRGIDVIGGVGEHIPFRDEVFDYVLLVVTLCFVKDPRAVVDESARVVRKGGRLIACIVPRDSAWGKYYMGKNSVFYRIAKFYSLGEALELVSYRFKVKRCVSTLSFGPQDEPFIEEPIEKCVPYGFVCIEALK